MLPVQVSDISALEISDTEPVDLLEIITSILEQLLIARS